MGSIDLAALGAALADNSAAGAVTEAKAAGRKIWFFEWRRVGTGAVDFNWAKEHHDLWLKEIAGTHLAGHERLVRTSRIGQLNQRGLALMATSSP